MKDEIDIKLSSEEVFVLWNYLSRNIDNKDPAFQDMNPDDGEKVALTYLLSRLEPTDILNYTASHTLEDAKQTLTKSYWPAEK